MAISRYLENNRASIPDEYYTTLKGYLDSFDQYTSQSLYSTYKADKFYSQFDSEEAYNKWLQYSTPEKRQEQYEKNKARLEELRQQKRESLNYQPGTSKYLTGDGTTTSSPYGAAQQNQQVSNLQSDIDKEIAKIEKEMRMYERGETDEAGNYYGSKVTDDYGKYLKDDAFVSASQNRAFQNGDRAALSAYDAEQSQGSMALSNGGYIDEDGNIRDAYGNVAQDTFEAPVQDKLGLFLSASDEDIGEAYTILGAVQGSYPTTWASILQEGDVKRWKHLKDDELQIYYGLLNTEGQEAAYRYLDAMEVELGRREMQQVKAYIDEASGLEQVMLNVASVPLKMIGGVAATIDNAGRLVTGQDLNPYSRAQSLLSTGNYIQSNTAQEIDAATGYKEIPGLGFSLGDAYQAGMSMVESLVGAKIGGKAYQAVMSMGAASSEMARLYSQGASMDQMVLGSVAAGAAEWVFEKYSIENLIDMKSPETLGQFLKNAFIQGGIEMSEEAATEFANILTNGLIMQSESDWAKALEENGGDYGKALKEMAIQIANAGLAGFLSGMGSGSIQQGMQYGAQQQENKKIGSYISGADSTDALVALALDMASGESGKAQKDLKNQSHRIVDSDFLTKGGKNKAIGRLYNTVNTVVTEKNISEISTALQEKGFSKKDATAIAGAVAVQASGLELTDKQQKVLEKFGSNEDVQAVLDDILNNEESGINQRAKSVAQFEFGALRNHIIASIEKELPGQENAGKSDTVDVQTENGTEGSYEVSAEGKTILNSTGEIVNIQEVADIQDGKMTLRLDDGSTVDANEVSYASKDEALIYETVAQMGASAKAANILVKGFKAAEGMNASAYAHGIEEAFRYGKMGIPERELAKSTFASKLNAGQQEYVYRQGQKAAGKQVAKEQATVRESKKDDNKLATSENRVGKVHFERNGRTFDDVREVSLKTMEQLAKALGVEFYVFESYKNENGERVYKDANGNEVPAPNGYYDPKDGSIHIDLNAGADGKGTMLFTIAHELTHFIKQWSPAKFKVLANFLMKQYGEKDVSVDKLVDAQIAKAEKAGREINREEAYEEMVADSMEAMLTDGNVVQMMAELKQQDRSLWEKICDWFKDLVADIQALVEAYKGVKPDSNEGRMVSKMQDVIVILESLYADALVDAGENYQAAKVQKNTNREAGEVKHQARHAESLSVAETQAIQNIGRKSIFAFSSADIKATERLAMRYWKEMGNKSPFFRAWFGDWRVSDQQPVQTADIRGNSRGTQKNEDTGWDIQVSGQVFNETKTHKSVASKEARPYLPYINDIVKKAVLLDTWGFDQSKIKSENSLLMHSLYAVADIGNGPEVLKLYVEEMNDPSRADTSKRAYQLQNIEKAFNASVRVQGNAPSSLTNTKNAIHTVADLFAYVKQMDNSFKPKNPSKIVDAGGKPKVMYHGSKAQFEVFDRTKAKSSGLYGKGFYFTDSTSHAGTYGNLYSVYLNINNPLQYGGGTATRGQVRKFLEAVAENEDYSIENYGTYDVDDVLKKVMGQKKSSDAFQIIQDISATAVGDMVEAAELFNTVNGTNYDGIVVPTETVSFYPTQIKSATDNIGTFDGKNPNIKYSGRNDESNGNPVDYGRIMDMQGEVSRLTQEIAAFEETEEFKTKMREIFGSSDIEKAMKDYLEWRKSSGYEGMIEKRDALKTELENARKQFDEYNAEQAANEEKTAIEKSGLSEAEYFRKQAVKEFGYTPYFYDAGYITPNGKMLNFSGEKGKHFGSRGQDHRAIGIIYENEQGTAAMVRFMNDGNIRIMAETPGLDISSAVAPTNDQYATIKKFVREFGSKERFFAVDISDENGRVVGQYAYDGYVNADRVVNDIKYYFENGKVREQSSIANFLQSDRDQEAEKVSKVLQKENAKLKEDVQYLKELLKLQRSVNDGTKFTRNSVESAASMLMKSANAKGDKKELAKLLDGFYGYIAKGEELAWEGVVEAAQPAVDWLQSHVETKKQLDSFAEDVLRDLRGSRIYLDETQKKEAAYKFGSYNEYRKKMMGTVIFTDKGSISLDSMWHELSELYPSVFDPNTNATDMPEALMDAVDRLRNMDVGAYEYAYDEDMMAQDLIRQVYETYWNVSTLKTVADVKQKQINRLKGEHIERMTQLREYHKKKTEQLKNEHREKLKRVQEEYREKAAKNQRELLKRYEESRKKGIDSRQRTAMRHKIKDVVNDLNQYLLKGTKDRHVPIGLQKAVAEALNAVNMDTIGAEERIAKLQKDLMKAKTPEAIQEISKKIEHIREMGDRMDERLKKLKEAYDEFINSDDPLIANSHDDGMSAHMMKLIVRVGDTPLREMTVDQLQDVYDVYKVVLATIRNANKAFKDNKNREISTIANQVMAEIDNLGVKKGKSIIGFDWVNKFGWDNLKPVYAMEHIGSRGLIEAFNNVRAGEDTWAKDIVEAREFYLERFKKYKYDSWDFEKKYKFTSTTGKDFELTLDQIMSLYAYSKRDQAEDHLRYGGIVFDPKTEVVEKTKSGIKVKYNVANATAYNISADTLAEIISILKDEQTDFVDEMQAYLSDVMGAKGNEVSLAMYDVKLFREKHYFPLKSAPQYMAKAKEQAMGEVKIKNSGFSKETKPHAKNPIVLSSFMDVWANHVNEMSMYHAFVLPMEDFYRIYNYTTPSKNEHMPTEGVTAYIENAYGSGATGYIEQMLKDLNGGARADSRTGILNWFMGKFKKGAVFASASVVIQQPSAIARAAALVDTKYFIGPKVDAKRHKLLWEEVKQYAPVAIIKEMGYFDTNMGKSTQDFITAKEHDGWFELIGRLDVKGLAKNTKDFVVDSDYRDEVLSWAPGYADELAWCGIWEAVKRETKAKNPGMDVKSEAFLEKAGERFTEVIVKTQVYDSVLARSANMRSKDTGMKMATAFMAEPTTSINMIGDALLKGKRGGTESKRYCRKAIGSVVASVILNSFLVAFVQAARDDDEDESIAEKYIGSFTAEVLDGLNPLTYIPFIKDIVSIVQGYDVERSDMSVISDIVNAVRKLSSDKVSGWKKVEDFVGSICQVFGLPVKNIMRDTRAVWQAFDTIINGEKTTARGTWYAVKSELPKLVGGGDVSNPEQLYKSRLAGDAAHTARVEARYAKGAEDAEEAAKSANAAVREAIKNDFLDGKIDSSTAMDRMVEYAGMTNDEAYWLMDKWKYRKSMGTEDGYSKFAAFFDAVKTGKNLKAVIKNYIDNGVTSETLTSQITKEFKDKYVEMSASERAGIKGYLINAFEQCGMLRTAAEEKLAGWDFEAKNGFDYANRGEAYRNREITKEQLKEALMTYGGMTEAEAMRYISEQDFQVATGYAYSDKAKAYKGGYLSADVLHTALVNIGGYSDEEADLQIEAYDWEDQGIADAVTWQAVRDYYEHCEPFDVPKDVYLYIRSVSNNTENDVDKVTGETVYYSAMKKVMAEINAQVGLTPAQKTAIARSLGWSEKNIRKYKLW